MNLRPYQAASIEEIRGHFAKGSLKVLLHLATGAGKTVVFSQMIKTAGARGRPCIMAVRGRKLVSQASKRLYREGVLHGVMMAGHWDYRPSLPIQVCSIDTMIARNWRPFMGQKPLLVIDEAHLAVSDGYKKFLADYPDAFIVAVTATPYSPKSLRHIADEIVHPVTMQELIDQGYLVPPRYFAPANPDTSQVKVSRSTGDFMTGELANLMDRSSITGDIVSHWKKIAENRPTIAFAVNIEHSKHLAKQFCDSGIAAEHCDADTKESEREEIIARLERGETKVVSNVGILCTGVDIPAVSCIIMARPTKSYALYIQCAGRGTRTHPGKKDFILLDHAGNVIRHGFITDEPEPNLDGRKFEETGSRPKRCEDCFAIVEAFPCPALVYRDDEHGLLQEVPCGWSPPQKDPGDRSVLHVEGELTELKGPSPLQRYECERFCEAEIQKCLNKKTNLWRAFYKTVEKFGEPAAKLVFFRICKREGLDIRKKKKEELVDGFPFK